MLTGGCGAYDESEYEPWVRGTTKEGARTLAPGSSVVAEWEITEAGLPPHNSSVRVSIEAHFVESSSQSVLVELQLRSTASSSDWGEGVFGVNVPYAGQSYSAYTVIGARERDCDNPCNDRIQLRVTAGEEVLASEPALVVDWRATLTLTGKFEQRSPADTATFDIVEVSP